MARDIFGSSGGPSPGMRNIFGGMQVEEKPGFVESFVEDTEKSMKAAGMQLGLYEPSSVEERQELNRRFKADAAMLGVSTITGGIAGAAMKGMGPVARAILGGALTGASGSAAFAGVEGDPIAPAAISGGLLGGAFGAIPGFMRKGAEEAADFGKAAVKAAPGLLDDVPSATRNKLEHQMATPPAVKLEDFGGQQELFPPMTITKGPAFEQLDMFRPRQAHAVASGITPSRASQPEFNNLFGEVTAVPSGSPTVIFRHAVDAGPEAKAAIAQAARRTYEEFLRGTPMKMRRGPRGKFPRRGRTNSETPLQRLTAEMATSPAGDMAAANGVVQRALAKLPIGDKFVAAYNDVTKFFNRAVVASGDAVSKMGLAGGELSKRMSQTVDRAARIAATPIADIESALGKMSTSQRVRIGGILHGDDVARNAEEQMLADKIRSYLDDVANAAADSKLREYVPTEGKIRPFAYRQNYFPLTYDDDTIRKYMRPGKEREAVLKHLMEQNQAQSRAEAEALLQRFLVTPPEFRYGHLQVAREMALPGFERDPLKVLPTYFHKAWKRIETAKEFGADDNIAAALIRRIGDEGYDKKLAHDTYFAFADKAPREFGALARATRTFNIVSLLSTAGLVQLGQSSNTIAVTGMRNYLKGLGGLFTREGRQWAARTGSYMQELIQEVVPANEQGLATWWLNFIRLTPLDKANRIIASLAGRYYADDLAAQYLRAPSKKLAKRLAEVGLDAEKIVMQGGMLTAEQRKIAAQQASHLTQFRGNPLDLPVLKNTAAGQHLYMFKTFTLQQMKFVNNLTDKARKGDVAPLMRYIAASGTLTAAVGEAARFYKNIGRTPEDKEPYLNYLQAAATGGALGMGYDFMSAMENGPEWVAKFVAGPTASQLFDLFGRDVPELAKGNPNVIMRDALRHTPLIGRQVANYFLPPEE